MRRVLVAWLLLCGSAFAASNSPPSIIATTPGQPSGPAQLDVAEQASALLVKPSGARSARTLADLMGEVINARSMGLVCDGTTDNATVLAVIAAKTVAASGQTVFFPPAALPCLTSAPLVASSGTTYTAYPGSVVLNPVVGSTANPVLFAAAKVSDVTVYGLTFDGGLGSATASTQANAGNVATVYQAAQVVFDHVIVRNTRGIGILFSTAVSYSGVRVSRFLNVGEYWQTSGANADQQQGVAFCCSTNNVGNFVDDSLFQSTGLDAISAVAQTDFQANNNRFVNVGGRYSNGGAAIYGSSNFDLMAVGNVADGVFGNGIDLHNSSHQTVTGNYMKASGGTGISLSGIKVGVASGNLTLNSNQSGGLSSLNSGFSLVGTNFSLTLAGNTSTDDQATKTQQYGIQGLSGMTCTNCTIDVSNEVNGNAAGAFGGAVTGYTSKISAAIPWDRQVGTSPNSGMALLPSEAGGVQVGPHDGSNTGGDATGTQSIDFYRFCQQTAPAASAPSAACLFGSNNLVAGQYASAGRQCNQAQGPSRSAGQFAADRYSTSADIWTFGYNAVLGDAQIGHHVLCGVTTSTAAKRLTADTGACLTGSASTQNCVNLPITNVATTPGLYGMSIRLVAVDVTNPNNLLHWWQPQYTIYKTGAPNTTTIIAAANPEVQFRGTVGSVSVSIDTTKACLNVIWTAPNADTWHVVARIDDVESF